MAFGKRMRPPEIACDQQVSDAAAEAASATPDMAQASKGHSDGPASDALDLAAQEFKDVLIEAFRNRAPSGYSSFHRVTVVAVAAAVLGQMAARMVYPGKTLDSMPATLPEGAANGPIFADAGRSHETIFNFLLIPARHRLSIERLPNPHLVAQWIAGNTGLSITPAHLPHVNPLAVMGFYDAIAMKIVRRENFDRKRAMLMGASCLVKLLQDENDDDNLAILIRLSLEIMLHSSRINPRRRD